MMLPQVERVGWVHGVLSRPAEVFQLIGSHALDEKLKRHKLEHRDLPLLCKIVHNEDDAADERCEFVLIMGHEFGQEGHFALMGKASQVDDDSVV